MKVKLTKHQRELMREALQAQGIEPGLPFEPTLDQCTELKLACLTMFRGRRLTGAMVRTQGLIYDKLHAAQMELFGKVLR